MTPDIKNNHSHSEILIVDDTLENLRLLADMLIAEGYRVRPTENPQLALESALAKPPELILLDIKMPGMDGFELCRRLKQDERTASVPIIFISALQDMTSRIRSFEVGGVDYITKPVQREEALARVATHIELYLMQKNLTALVDEKVQALRLDDQRFSALYELSQMREAPDEALTAFALEAAVKLTRSELGYLHFIDEDEKNMTLYQWSQKTREQFTAKAERHHTLKETAVWADCVQQRQAVIHNDSKNPRENKAFPEGHAPLQRQMNVPIFDQEKIVAIIGVGNKPQPYDETDAGQLSLFGGNMWSIFRAKRVEQQQQESLIQTIQAIAMTLEQRDPYTAGHQRRVADLSCSIAEEMGLEKKVIEGIRMGGMIHDIGKIHIPAEFLNKPSKLSDTEFSIIKTHAEVGYQIVKDINFPWPVADIIRQHHERLDGSGYPQGLKSDEIIAEAKILAVADVIEAMASDRPYRAGLGIDIALEEIKKGRGDKFDADVVDICVRLFVEKGYTLVTP
ncbi:HD domain-containing phosphohydrolase [Pseudomonadota bacterium]